MKCQFIKNSGQQCAANSISDSQFCYFHSEVDPEEKRLARVRGGKCKRVGLSEALPVLAINEPKDIIFLLADTIARVRENSMDCKVANCLGVLCSTLLKTFETCQIENRVEIVEQKILEKKTTYNN